MTQRHSCRRPAGLRPVGGADGMAAADGRRRYYFAVSLAGMMTIRRHLFADAMTTCADTVGGVPMLASAAVQPGATVASM